MTRLVAKIVQVRYTYLAPVIIMFCFARCICSHRQHQRADHLRRHPDLQLTS